MSNIKNTKDKLLVAKYKAEAQARLAERRKTRHELAISTPPGLAKDNETLSPVTLKRGVIVTLQFAPNSKPMSSFGGVSKVLGPSKFKIPELKRSR